MCVLQLTFHVRKTIIIYSVAQTVDKLIDPSKVAVYCSKSDKNVVVPRENIACARIYLSTLLAH